MAPTFRHGKGIRPLINRYDFSPHLNSAKVSASMMPGETTTFQKNDKTYIIGLRDATISLEGLFSAATAAASTEIADVFGAALGGSTSFVVTVDIEGTTGGRAWLMKGDLTKFDVSSPVSNVVSCSADVQGSQGYRGGRMLRPLGAATSTGSNSGITTPGTTSAGGSTGGGVAHLHITSQSTLTSITFKVQHSTTGSTWADLVTFTAATAETFQRSTVSGTVKERLRSTISAFTGGAGKTVTAAVAFARHGRT